MNFVAVFICALCGGILEGTAQWKLSKTEFDWSKFYSTIKRGLIAGTSSTILGLIPDLSVACMAALCAGMGISLGINKDKANL